MQPFFLAYDEPHLRMLVRTTLDAPEYRMREAVDGPTAWALAR
jgi:hypothetical protein